MHCDYISMGAGNLSCGILAAAIANDQLDAKALDCCIVKTSEQSRKGFLLF